MPLSDDQLQVVRSWVGTAPTQDELDSLYDQFGSVDKVVELTLRARLAEYTSQPASLSVPGLSISNQQNITSLENLIKKFESDGGTGLDSSSVSGVRVAHLKRIVPR